MVNECGDSLTTHRARSARSRSLVWVKTASTRLMSSSMAMLSSHHDAVCCHSVSGSVPVAFVTRSTVEAAAANPQRDGKSHANCSSTARPVIVINPPHITSCAMIVTTSIGSTCSFERATDDNASPTSTQVQVVTAI
mgnify:CR=1 FL=1